MKLYDLEQQIMACWNLVDDVDLLYQEVLGKDLHEDQDKLANALLGLSTIYHMKFEKLHDMLEDVIEERHEYHKVEEEEPAVLHLPL